MLSVSFPKNFDMFIILRMTRSHQRSERKLRNNVTKFRDRDSTIALVIRWCTCDLSLPKSATISRNSPGAASSTISRAPANLISRLAGHHVQGGAVSVLSSFPMERNVRSTARDPHLPLHHAVAQELSRESLSQNRRLYVIRAMIPAVFAPHATFVHLLCCSLHFPGLFRIIYSRQ
jgi:hypothetical protein